MMHLTYIILIVLPLCLFLSSIYGAIYNVDDSGGYGRRFDGIGGLSGGGATSKLLVNYPEQQRNEILDYLFKPSYGASLQILKVEIGGDAQSTEGTESSHMHESWDENYQRGYEWWLMVEAKKRNPNIILYGLPWAFPGWIGNGTQNPYLRPDVTADYVIRWIMGAKTYYNLKIDIIGIWNEHPYSTTYIKLLRRMLDDRGLTSVRICAADDNGWLIVNDMLEDQQLTAAIDSVGSHYPGTISVPDAVRTGKPLWASEDYSTFNDNTGAGCWARLLNQNYVNGLMTSTISWNLLASYYYGLPHYREGLMTATEPWSGSYTVESPIWITAHTTQFTKPGWRYLSHGSGVGKLTAGGSYVTLTDTFTHQLTIVLETVSHDHSVCIRPPLPPYHVVSQNVTFKLAGSFAKIQALNVWYTKLGFNGQQSIIFKQMTSLQVVNEEVTLTLGVDEIWTLTTLTTGQKGSGPNPPPSQPFPLPYMDDFDSYKPPTEPFNLAQQKGVWETMDLGPPHNGVIRQVMTQLPVFWCGKGPQHLPHTANVIGDFNWTDIYVQIDVRASGVNFTEGYYIAARIDLGGCNVSLSHGLFFFVFPSEQQYELTHDIVRNEVIKTGSTLVNTEWNTLSLLLKGGYTAGFINGKSVFNVTTPYAPTNGFVGIGTTTPGLADFDNLHIDNPNSVI